ncbi:hypothetical protein [Polaromonas sp.]|uniref:hypothetical protein n=1 Tax=Polaromonas sp. TaxID=1869339 RepID=UPI00352A1074
MDKVSYLTPSLIGENSFSDADVLHSSLLRALGEIKQARAGGAQWAGIINALSQKGVKAAEIEDSHIHEYLGVQDATAKITKEDVLHTISRRLPRIKCVELANGDYAHYRNIQNGRFQERLYILSSEAMVADDMMEDLMYRIENLGFDPAPLLADPQLVDKLEAEMNFIKSQRPEMFDFRHHHYASRTDAYGKNLMAHARISYTGDMMFIEEIQSDWAQRGRANNWAPEYPKAPLVTHTEQWAGAVLRDLLHQAALDPTVKDVAWIRGHMRNGFDQTEEGQSDGLSMFYDTIIRKLADKCINKAGGKIEPREVLTKNGPKTVLGFTMTDSVRAALTKSLPMYSRDAILPRSVVLDDPSRTEECARVVNECTAMLGSAHTIRFVAKLYDAAHTNEVPGKYLNSGIMLSLRAKHLDRAARHEAWHFASENFLLAHERREMRLAFGYGSELNTRTQEILRSLGSHAAAEQCIDDKECAAHAFSLWCEGRLVISDEKPRNIFAAVATSISKMADWMEGLIFGVKVQTPEDLFKAMKNGGLAARHQMSDAQDHAPTPAS